MICPSCRQATVNGACRLCGAVYVNGKWRWSMSSKRSLPNWKPEEVLYCSACEVAVKKDKAKREPSFLREGGFFCPVCDEKLGDLEESK